MIVVGPDESGQRAGGMTKQSKRARAADLALLEPEEGFEPSTFRLPVGP
jgi:hypothetical protein